MKTIIFRRHKGIGYQPVEEEFEFEDNATEDEITKEYIEWVWQEAGDEFTWYEKEES